MQISGTQINPTEIIVENDYDVILLRQVIDSYIMKKRITAKELVEFLNKSNMGMFPGLITDNCPDCGVPHANESICHSCEHIY